MNECINDTVYQNHHGNLHLDLTVLTKLVTQQFNTGIKYGMYISNMLERNRQLLRVEVAHAELLYVLLLRCLLTGTVTEVFSKSS
jgi:hypothetical protein